MVLFDMITKLRGSSKTKNTKDNDRYKTGYPWKIV